MHSHVLIAALAALIVTPAAADSFNFTDGSGTISKQTIGGFWPEAIDSVDAAEQVEFFARNSVHVKLTCERKNGQQYTVNRVRIVIVDVDSEVETSGGSDKPHAFKLTGYDGRSVIRKPRCRPPNRTVSIDQTGPIARRLMAEFEGERRLLQTQ